MVWLVYVAVLTASTINHGDVLLEKVCTVAMQGIIFEAKVWVR